MFLNLNMLFKSTRYIYIGMVALGLSACIKLMPDPTDPSQGESSFENAVDRGALDNPRIMEASGIGASRKNPGYFWVTNDSDVQGPMLYLIDSLGKGKKEYLLSGATHRDWEDLAVVTESDGSATVYVADFGDNFQDNPNYAIYWFKDLAITSNPYTVLTDINKLTFRLPDGFRDMETLLIDQKSKDIFVITKRENSKRLYKIPAAKVLNGTTVTAEYIQDLTFSTPFSSDAKIQQAYFLTGGSVSPDNSEILIRNYIGIYYWKRKTGESIPEALLRPAKAVPYLLEPQGEGVTFSLDGSGYYTLSESPDLVPAHLYYYKKK
ncbi:MAG: hypothetical protein KA527_06950 [Cytophagaceae bacterium]|nr:hypothetical protein [Cytophagaceae bacterium]MBP6093745.1 hypothetical protein [Cytophagaceae bacterium]